MNIDLKKASIIKIILVIGSYVLSFLYVDQLAYNYYYVKDIKTAVLLTLITAGFVVWLELTMWYQRLERKVPLDKVNLKEARFWEVILILLSTNLGFGADSDFNFFVMHIVVVYMVLCGLGRLFSGESSIYIMFDLVNGFIKIPFSHFTERVKTFISGVSNLNAESSEEEKGKRLLVTIVSTAFIIVALIVFWSVFVNLSEIDNSFNSIYNDILDYFEKLDLLDADVIVKVILSILLGIYLSALYFGSANNPNSFEKESYDKLEKNLPKAKVIPGFVFYLICGLYIVLYILFFISQARILFSGLFGILPEEFTASRYAREGFSQLAFVLFVNFMGFGAIRFLSNKNVYDNKPTSCCSITLMVTNIIFSIISASKIILYISRFGYTDLRAMSLWVTVVAFAGSALAIYNILTNKKTFKYWMYFSAATFIIMNFIAGFCQMAS